MAATKRSITAEQTEEQSNQSLDGQEWEDIKARMPASIKASSFAMQFGRVFECPECGHESGGTCQNCGTTHPRLRSDPTE